MQIGLVFWILMLVWLVFGFWINWPANGSADPVAYGLIGGNLLLFLVVALLGWKVFGSPVKD